MDIKDLEILVECKRLVESMLKEKEYILSRLDGNGKDVQCVRKQIVRMDRALKGLPPLTFEERFGCDGKTNGMFSKGHL